MSIFEERKERLLTEMAKLHGRHELSQEVGPDYFEPGMMEYLEQSLDVFAAGMHDRILAGRLEGLLAPETKES